MTVAFATVADTVANITAMLPIVQDAFTYAGNWFVGHPIGVLILTMTLFAFGIGMIKSLVRGGRRKK